MGSRGPGLVPIPPHAGSVSQLTACEFHTIRDGIKKRLYIHTQRKSNSVPRGKKKQKNKKKGKKTTNKHKKNKPEGFFQRGLSSTEGAVSTGAATSRAVQRVLRPGGCREHAGRWRVPDLLVFGAKTCAGDAGERAGQSPLPESRPRSRILGQPRSGGLLWFFFASQRSGRGEDAPQSLGVSVEGTRPQERHRRGCLGWFGVVGVSIITESVWTLRSSLPVAQLLPPTSPCGLTRAARAREANLVIS